MTGCQNKDIMSWLRTSCHHKDIIGLINVKVLSWPWRCFLLSPSVFLCFLSPRLLYLLSVFIYCMFVLWMWFYLPGLLAPPGSSTPFSNLLIPTPGHLTCTLSVLQEPVFQNFRSRSEWMNEWMNTSKPGDLIMIPQKFWPFQKSEVESWIVLILFFDLIQHGFKVDIETCRVHGMYLIILLLIS